MLLHTVQGFDPPAQSLSLPHPMPHIDTHSPLSPPAAFKQNVQGLVISDEQSVLLKHAEPHVTLSF